MVPALSVSGWPLRVFASQFSKHARGEPSINEVVGVVADNGGALHAVRSRPSLEPKYLIVELVGESHGPGLQFLGNELLKYRRQGFPRTDFLIPGGLIDQADNADPPQASIESVRPLDNMSLRRRKIRASKLISDGLWVDWRQWAV